MPFFRSKYLQVLGSVCLLFAYVFICLRAFSLLSVSQPPATNKTHLINLSGKIGHKSFIKLVPFGFSDQSFFRTEIVISFNNLPKEHANELHLTNSTTLFILLCNENDWKTIKSVNPSYCETESYRKKKLCEYFPLNAARIQSKKENTNYVSKTAIWHTVKTSFYGRLVVSSCELRNRLDSQASMDLKMGLTMANKKNHQYIYIGFENEHQVLLSILFGGLSLMILIIWVLMLILYRKSATSLQKRFSFILLSKIFLFFFNTIYWLKRTRGDRWQSYKNEMLQLKGALEISCLAILLENLLLISVGWKITQKRLSKKSWQFVYGCFFTYFVIVLTKIIASANASNTSLSAIVSVISFLIYLVATFTTYYLIGFATTANIEALLTQLDLIRYVMGISPQSTPSYLKLKLFRNFRLWVIIFLTLTTLFNVVSLIVRGNDDHEKYDMYIDAIGFMLEIICCVILLWVFRPQKRANILLRQIPVVQVDITNIIMNDENRVVPQIDQTDNNNSIRSQQLQRLPTVTGVRLENYTDMAPLPPIRVGRLLDRDSYPSNAITGRIISPVIVVPDSNV
jgi:hypothetical protein